MLSILLLGSPSVARDGRPVAVPRRKARALLYYLAARDGPVTREHLLAFFWPDHAREAGQRLLRTTLHTLRAAIGPALQSDARAIAIGPEVEVDARRFAAGLSPVATDEGRLRAALALYRGDFLAEFTLGDASEFDAWAAAQAERCRRLAVRGLVALSQRDEARRAWSAALDALDHALALDPFQEEIQRAALRLHALAGDRGGAIRRYEQLRRLLDEELGVPPMSETRALYEAILFDALPSPPTPPSPPALRPPSRGAASGAAAAALRTPPTDLLPFIGREAERGALHALTASPALVLVEGEPGIGKTRLLDEFNRAVSAAAPATLRLGGAARELEQALPYQPIIEALRGLLADPAWPAERDLLDLPAVWLAEVGRLIPELLDVTTVAAGPPADESRLWEALHQFLSRLAHGRRLLLTLDDLHWADASTLGLLGYLVRAAARSGAPIAFLAASRPVAPGMPLATLVQALMREGALAALTLVRLTPADTLALARRLSPPNAEPLAAWLTRLAEGNPYILAELVRDARATGLLQPDGAVDLAGLATARVPPTIVALIQSRLARLSEPARRVLDAAVAAGREFDADVVARAAAVSDAAALDALGELQAAGLVQPGDGLRYAFDHSLIQEVAEREIGEPRHRLLHRRVAEALAGLRRDHRDPVAGLIAQHYVDGHAPEQAAPYALQAGRRAAALASWPEAIAFFNLALTGADERQRRQILPALAAAHRHAERLEQGRPPD